MLLFILFGYILAASIREYVASDRQNSTLNAKLSVYQTQLETLTAEKEQLAAENLDLTTKKNNITEEILKEQGFSDLADELASVRQLAGFTSVGGNGVTVTLNDSTLSDDQDVSAGIIHSQDVQYIVETLKNLGAEAISINGERIVSTTVITCLGPTIRVNDARYPVPFVIIAVCDAESCEAALLSDAYILYRKSDGVEITIEKHDEVEVPAYNDIAAIDFFCANVRTEE